MSKGCFIARGVFYRTSPEVRRARQLQKNASGHLSIWGNPWPGLRIVGFDSPESIATFGFHARYERGGLFR